MSLIPLFALVGLGSDSLSSSCYGPEEAYRSLGPYPHLIIFVALLSILTIWAISASYCQIIELFPRGGGGYLVASKLLNPAFGLVSGCALLVDYVLTITISVASGIDALFSIFPKHYELEFEAKLVSILLLTLLNLRGIKESIFPWVPIFALFIITHGFAFFWSFFHHADAFPMVVGETVNEITQATSAIGWGGLLILILKSFSMGAGTFTGIEAVSNGMNIIREPKVQNAKKTMVYISVSLALTVSGLVISFLLYDIKPLGDQTINAVLFGKVGEEVGGAFGGWFQAVALFSETALLFVAAETGFLGGPQVLANMAVDRWFPHKFMTLSDRYVMRHGILLMGAAAGLVMFYTKGSVAFLVVLYSLTVFITFTLSQSGMVLHWLKVRDQDPTWRKRLVVNGIGLLFSVFILISLILVKFEEGAWETLLVVSLLVLLGMSIKRYYKYFNTVLAKIYRSIPSRIHTPFKPATTMETQTAVLMVSGIHGLAQHSIANVIQLFGNTINHFVFMQVGLLDAESFKGENEVKALTQYVHHEAERLVKFMEDKGYSAESVVAIGLDIADEVEKLALEIYRKHPGCIFFGGQLVLPKDTLITRWMHNQTLYSIQRRFYQLQLPFVTLPVYIKYTDEKTMQIIAGMIKMKS